MHCPVCSTEQVRKFSIVYEEGTSRGSSEGVSDHTRAKATYTAEHFSQTALAALQPAARAGRRIYPWQHWHRPVGRCRHPAWQGDRQLVVGHGMFFCRALDALLCLAAAVGKARVCPVRDGLPALGAVVGVHELRR